MAESFVDSFKTELITDRLWRTRSQLELAVVEYIGWFNHQRLHEALGDIPPVEFEQLHRFAATDLDIDVGPLPLSDRVALFEPALAKTAPKVVVQRALPAGLSDE